MIERIDDLARTLRLERPARRIVCLVPSITETLFSLGAGEFIAGITDYCIHPEDEVRTKPKIGGTKNFFVDKVIRLEPDLVVANAEENRRHQVEKLEEAGLKVFVTFPKSIEGCLKMIADMAALTGTDSASRPLLASIETARCEARMHAPDPPCRVLCPIWKDPWMTISHDTFVDSVIRNSGGRNVFEDSTDRYPQFTLGEAVARHPDVIILPTEPYHFTEADKAEFFELGDRVQAIRGGRIHIVEGELLSWYGPRLGRALSQLSAIISNREIDNV
jgi:ABC-type Fe3+-hydroxamate transport system substrate-binding protein